MSHSPWGSKELDMTEQLTHMHRGSHLKRTGGWLTNIKTGTLLKSNHVPHM